MVRKRGEISDAIRKFEKQHPDCQAQDVVDALQKKFPNIRLSSVWGVHYRDNNYQSTKPKRKVLPKKQVHRSAKTSVVSPQDQVVQLLKDQILQKNEQITQLEQKNSLMATTILGLNKPSYQRSVS
ncbi:MAG: hypothetical protein ACXABY_03315 [Candidatus Thorarchaeota archaeon]